MKISFFFFLLAGVFFSCNNLELNNQSAENSKIMVEGSIEEGGNVSVFLSRTIPVNAKIDTLDALSYAIRSAKVTVSDGESEEVLKVKSNDATIPPYEYYGEQIIGKAGKVYVLKVEYLDKVITSSTRIPEMVPIKSIEYVPEDSGQSKGYLNVSFDDPKGVLNYYQILTKLDNTEKVFVPALYGCIRDKGVDGQAITAMIYRGQTLYPHRDFELYYSEGDMISVKLRTMEKQGYEFWNSWQNEVINGNSPIFPNTVSLKSNIIGGLGIWQGYSQHTVIVKAEKK